MGSTYTPGQVPDDPKQIPAFLRNELNAIKRALEDAEPVARLQVLGTAPARSQDGDEAEAAAGVLGVSAGKYVYRSGAWVFIG